MMIIQMKKRRAFMGASVLALGAGMTLSAPALAQDGAQTEDQIVVTGFRSSLGAALDQKKAATGAIDAIVAEDIADFPDLNLAESLQRIPGVTITRDSGEGRQITVRGLSGEFTRIRINGMEAIAASGGEGGPNRGREFDFNVFASELFNSIVVHKTASADLDEGSLGAVVDLNTGRAFNYDEGVTFVVSAQGQYNALNEDLGPRAAALFAYNDPSGVWGATASVAYSDSVTSELGHNTVRWQRAAFNSVSGVDCGANPADAGCEDVAGAFHPRIPRYGEIELNRERIGVTAGLQFQPTDRTLITVDGLYSNLDASRDERWLEVLFRGNEGGMDVLDYTLDPSTNNLTSMTVNNAWVRTENFQKAWTTEFYQIGLNLDHDFSDTFRMNGMVGKASSELDFPHEVTFMYDDRDYNGFFYDYTDDKNPVLAYNGPDVSDPANFQLTELRDRPSNTKHKFDNAEVSFEWDAAEALTFSAGASYKKFTFETTEAIRDTGVCGAGLFDCDLDNDGTDDLIGVPATADLTDVYKFPDDVAAGSTNVWAIPSLDGWIDFFDLFNSVSLNPNQGNIRNVEEKNIGAFVQVNGAVPIGSMELRYDAGVRYVRTDQESSGFNSGIFVSVDRDPYDDWLPSGNLALFITDDFVWRASGAKVMTRPGLGSLTPGGTVDSFNYRVSFQNPFLDPTRATALDTSLEWYFAEESLLSFALFYKDIASRPINETSEGTYASTGLPASLLVPTSPAAANPEGGPAESCNPANGGSGCWEIRSIVNGPGGNLWGFEVGMQAPFSELLGEQLPPLIRNMGFIANYTYVDSDVDYNIGGETITERLFGLSNSSYNATLYYEDDKLSARVSLAARDDYLTGTSGTGNIFEGFGGTFNVDFSSTYHVSDAFDITFEALNLTDDYQDRFTDLETRRRYEWDHTGRVFLLGGRYRF